MAWTGLRIPSFLGGCYLFLVRAFQGCFWCLPNEPFPERFEKGDQGHLQGEHFLLRIQLGDGVCQMYKEKSLFSKFLWDYESYDIKTWLGATASPKIQKTSKKNLSLIRFMKKCLVSDLPKVSFAVFRGSSLSGIFFTSTRSRPDEGPSYGFNESYLILSNNSLWRIQSSV